MSSVKLPGKSSDHDKDTMDDVALLSALRELLATSAQQGSADADGILKRIRFRLSVSHRRAELLQQANKVAAWQERTLREIPDLKDAFKCNICGYFGKFTAFGHKKRPNSQCPVCDSFERTRFMVAYLETASLLKKRPLSVLELAPTKGLHDYFRFKLGVNYTGIDIEPELLIAKGMNVKFCDLCASDLKQLGQFDIIINSHVMEHVRCDPVGVIAQLSELLKFGGVQLLSLPFAGDSTIEDLNPSLSSESRLRRFGHPDHMRAFGHIDFPEKLYKHFGSRYYEVHWSEIPNASELSLAVMTDSMRNGNRLFGIRSAISF